MLMVGLLPLPIARRDEHCRSSRRRINEKRADEDPQLGLQTGQAFVLKRERRVGLGRGHVVVALSMEKDEKKK
jgi:hypothetical protein